jgi:diguanylate cyclase (GGDEF)-like protein
LVEDSPAQGAQVKTSLEAMGYEVVWVHTAMEALRVARHDHPDLVLLDVMLEDMDGFAVCRWLKLHDETREIPVIMLTARTAVEDRVEGLHVGADDYLPKPFAEAELGARIFAALRDRAAKEELKKKNAQLEAMLHRVEALAATDPLSGLYNRRRFADVLRREFAVCKRYKNELACIMVDLDHFKLINDRYGHEAGDLVLKEVAKKLTENLREVDVPARYGGEEFAILLPHTSKEQALVVAERLQDRIRQVELDIDGEVVKVTASFGIAGVGDVESTDAERLVKFADAALYEAKAAGRDRIITWSDDLGVPPSVVSVRTPPLRR